VTHIRPSELPLSALAQVHMLKKAKQKPRKVGAIRDARVDTLPSPEGDPK
jgi:diacylglycerol kinase (ATP)